MKTHSHIQRCTNTESSEPLITRPKPTPSNSQHEPPQPQAYDLSHIDLFSHAPQRTLVQMKLRSEPESGLRVGANHTESVIQLFPAIVPQPPFNRTPLKQKTQEVNSEAELNKYIKAIVDISKKDSNFDPYTEIIKLTGAIPEQIMVGGSASWKDKVIKVLECVRAARGVGKFVTEQEVKDSLKAKPKPIEKEKTAADYTLVQLLTDCGFKFGNYYRYNPRTGKDASCAVLQASATIDGYPFHATYFLPANNEDKVVKNVLSMKDTMISLHITVEVGAEKNRPRYWPLSKENQRTGNALTSAGEKQIEDQGKKLVNLLASKIQ